MAVTLQQPPVLVALEAVLVVVQLALQLLEHQAHQVKVMRAVMD
jgi:hypothetical protein